MLEELSMEKKPSSRSVQPPAKGCGTEGKKAQDTTNNVTKQFPRQSRRREAPGSKFEQSRKQGPQKQNRSANYDKRPKPRGQLYYGCGKADTQIADELADQFGLVTTSTSYGNKKQSLNHLLNFHYAPRGEQIGGQSSFYQRYSGGSHGGGSYGGSKWLMSTQKHKYNKEQFLQANCQFVVRSDGNYTPYKANPDTLVDWDLIEQIRVLSYEPVTCPICLDTPTAGKITRCGHVFCWSCILHYLALSDKTWRKCPICYESVHRNDLKSVLVLLRPIHSVGEQITFQLMKRERGSLVTSPVSQYEVRTTHDLLSIDEKEVDVIYSKLLTADFDQVMSVIDFEMKELKTQASENEGCPEMCFIEEAIQLLTERKNALLSRINNDNTCNNNTVVQDKILEEDVKCSNAKDSENANDIVTSSDSSPLVSPKECLDFTRCFPVNKEVVQEDEAAFDIDSFEARERCRYTSASSTSEGEDCIMQDSTISAEDLEINCTPCTSGASKHFYFYQAVDGQQLFMHAVNVRMLEINYGSLENSPLLITGTILEKESGSMTEELRKRLRYLQHLPVTCQFEVAEIDLKPPVITNDTMIFFKEQLTTRKKRREKKARDERRREKKMTEQVHMQYGMLPTPRLRINSLQHFPECGSDLASSPPSASHISIVNSYPDIGRRDDAPQLRPVSPAQSSRASSPVSRRSNSPSSSSGGPSFAQMLRDGKSSGSGWPLPSARKKTASAVGSHQVPHYEDDEVNPIAAPHYQESFSDAIAIALEKATVQHDKEETLSGNGKKKKRKQKVLLFATGMACNSK